jgi:hypothetical protein
MWPGSTGKWKGNSMASNIEGSAQSNGYDYDAGADIFGADGQRLGALSEKGVQSGFLVVHHGTLMGKDAYVPLSQVVDTRQDGIYLNVGKDELARYNTDGPPSEAPRDVGGAGGGDTWTYQGEGAPAASGQPITQPAPLRMRAPQRTSGGLGANSQFAQDTTDADTTDANQSNQAGATGTWGVQQDERELGAPLDEDRQANTNQP